MGLYILGFMRVWAQTLPSPFPSHGQDLSNPDALRPGVPGPRLRHLVQHCRQRLHRRHVRELAGVRWAVRPLPQVLPTLAMAGPEAEAR
jgi:hypothetical protein